MTLGGGATMGRKRTMAYSNSHRPAASVHPRAQRDPVGCVRSRAYSESGHQLEKLEFALAVAITRGDAQRVDHLRQQIAELGGNREEPGT